MIGYLFGNLILIGLMLITMGTAYILLTITHKFSWIWILVYLCMETSFVIGAINTSIPQIITVV
jgi:hypothetical protein